MDLLYFKAKKGNVGDDLNAWLWPRIFPTLFDNDTSEVFIGIGSILDARYAELPYSTRKVVFGSGARGKKEVPELDDSWDVQCVRGPSTQAALGSQYHYITDPAILLSLYFKKISSSTKPKRIGLVPHFRSPILRWQLANRFLGWDLIPPTLNVVDFVDRISRCSMIVTEAMHGAIFADSLRIPWFPVSSTTIVNDTAHFFKWQDWCESMELSFTEEILPPIPKQIGKASLQHKAGKAIKVAQMSYELAQIAQKKQFLLSDDVVFDSKLAAMCKQVESFARQRKIIANLPLAKRTISLSG